MPTRVPWRGDENVPVFPLTHDGLVADLASWESRLDAPTPRVAWCNIELAGGRPDVFSIVTTLTLKRLHPRVYEVKVGLADLLHDLKIHKWQKYWPVASKLFYAMPETLYGALQRKEQANFIPPDVGIMCRTSLGWYMAKRSRGNPAWKLTERQLVKLILATRTQSPYELLRHYNKERMRTSDDYRS